MAHGLTKFSADLLVTKAQGAIALFDTAAKQGADANLEATQETMRIILENQIEIAETLNLIKQEFDKFEAGLGKIL